MLVFNNFVSDQKYLKFKILPIPCCRLIYKWRDQTARSEDESTAFVLPNHMMLKIAELLPGDQEGSSVKHSLFCRVSFSVSIFSPLSDPDFWRLTLPAMICNISCVVFGGIFDYLN